jgi:hypothetical protein
MGAVILPLLGLYLILLIWATRYGYRWAEKKGWTGKKRWLGAAYGFLIVYLPLFWDWIPTVAMHQYTCSTEAGFWVYKSVDQWKAENPGVMETLPVPSSAGSPIKYGHFDNGYGESFTYLLNERFNWIITQQDISNFLPIIRIEQEVKDVQKNEVLARYVDLATGNSVKDPVGPPGSLKFWMRSQHCIGGERDQDNLRSFRENFYGSKK